MIKSKTKSKDPVSDLFDAIYHQAVLDSHAPKTHPSASKFLKTRFCRDFQIHRFNYYVDGLNRA